MPHRLNVDVDVAAFNLNRFLLGLQEPKHIFKPIGLGGGGQHRHCLIVPPHGSTITREET